MDNFLPVRVHVGIKLVKRLYDMVMMNVLDSHKVIRINHCIYYIGSDSEAEGA